MPLQLGTCDPSKYRCNSQTGYVLPFKKLSRFRPLRGRLWGVCDTPLQSGTCGPSKNCFVFVPFGAVGWAYSICPYNWVRVALRNTDVIPRPGTCEGSKNGSVYATVGGVWWGVCDTPLRPGTCGPSKNCPVFVPFGAACEAFAIRPYNRVRAIFRNTDAILQLGMCDSSKYRCDSPTGYVRFFEIPIRSPDRRGGGVWDVGRWGYRLRGRWA